MKIVWAPLRVPFHKRLETLAAGCWMFLFLFCELIALFSYFVLLYKGNLIIKALCIVYGIFIYTDRKTGENGGRGAGSEWVRNWIWWKYYQQYFPATIVKTVDLPADRNYIFAAFPHGLLSSACFCNFATNMTTFRQDFPGIRSKVLTLGFHFYIPFFRELLLSWGVASCSAKSIVRILSASNATEADCNRDGFTSNAAVLLIGGAQEALNCRPDNYTVVLKNRKGFIKIALKTGVSVVPIISFGEVDLFDQPPNPPGSRLRRGQEFVKNVTGIAPTCFIGRGLFQYSFGMIPRRRPLWTVVGAPMEVPKMEEFTGDDIDKYHSAFCAALDTLFETHKQKYVPNYANVKLVIE